MRIGQGFQGLPRTIPMSRRAPNSLEKNAQASSSAEYLLRFRNPDDWAVRHEVRRLDKMATNRCHGNVVFSPSSLLKRYILDKMGSFTLGTGSRKPEHDYLDEPS